MDDPCCGLGTGESAAPSSQVVNSARGHERGREGRGCPGKLGCGLHRSCQRVIDCSPLVNPRSVLWGIAGRFGAGSLFARRLVPVTDFQKPETAMMIVSQTSHGPRRRHCTSAANERATSHETALCRRSSVLPNRARHSGKWHVCVGTAWVAWKMPQTPCWLSELQV